MDRRRLLALIALILGVVLIAIAVVYWAEPAKSLPSFFPGQQAGSNHHHVKHGIAAFLLGVACLVFAWFNTGEKKTAPEPQ
jgi:UDP-N-acetylmuramyl pentapeptide phosphotransferase/UDP-N-acetylglucosamine-1-phosphate transferase